MGLPPLSSAVQRRLRLVICHSQTSITAFDKRGRQDRMDSELGKRDDQVDALFSQQEVSGAAMGLLHKERPRLIMASWAVRPKHRMNFRYVAPGGPGPPARHVADGQDVRGRSRCQISSFAMTGDRLRSSAGDIACSRGKVVSTRMVRETMHRNFHAATRS